MFYPDIETVRIYATQYHHIPIYAQIPYEGMDIVSIYAAFRGPYSFLLESGEQTYHGRYSIIALPCHRVLKATEQETMFVQDGNLLHQSEEPLELLKKCLNKKSPIYPNLPVFTGGAIGHFNYDCIRLYEDIPDSEKSTLDLPLFQFGFTQEVIIIDHQTNIVSFVSDMEFTSSIDVAYEAAKHKIEDMMKRYYAITPYATSLNAMNPTITSNYTKEAFINMVNSAKEYIRKGDIFQVVLSQRMKSEYTDDPLHAYVNMRQSGASPYMYYLDFEDYVIAGVSPELLLQARGNSIKTMPIAGTRKRGKTSDEDEQLAQELCNDSKENAEHMMLVDLGRNDIGKVSTIGSVQVKHLKEIQRYSHVMHMTSEVHGTLAKEYHALDALCCVLPAGTLSGAPKIRAMEIIDELENTKREIYGGAIGFLGYNGQFDTCITIRSMVFHNEQVYVQAGAGIVKDSVPEKEYEETLHKAAVLLTALGAKASL